MSSAAIPSNAAYGLSLAFNAAGAYEGVLTGLHFIGGLGGGILGGIGGLIVGGIAANLLIPK